MPPEPKQLPNWDYAVTLAPTCALIGQRMTVTMRLEPDARTALSVVYGDGESRGTNNFGKGGADGTVTFAWSAPASPGEGIVLTTATDKAGTKGGSKTVKFRIAEVGTTC